MARGTRSSSLIGDMARGALAGAAATWLMDLVTTGMVQQQSEAAREREEAARPNGRSSVDNLVARLEQDFNLRLDDGARARLSSAIHYGLGAVPGAAYAALANRVPLVGAANGLLYGVVLWALNDEYLNTKLGLAGPFDAYPGETHWRGLVGHVVLGAATHTLSTLRVPGRG